MERDRIQQITIWQQTAGDAWQAHAASGPRGLSTESPSQQATWLADLADDVVIHPLRGGSGAVAMLLNRGRRAVAVNGVPVPSGMRLLWHADRLDVSGRTFWISAATSVEQGAYDPALHGDDVFCFLTKARLTAGQQITICPGVPGASCGVIYKAEAWEMAMHSANPMKCPNCGFRPGAAEWQPSQPRTRNSIDGLLRLACK